MDPRDTGFANDKGIGSGLCARASYRTGIIEEREGEGKLIK
jgi:hypothetical protein